MRNTTLLAFAVMLSIVPPAGAQDGLRSASLPERPIASAPPGPEDRFRVSPDHWLATPDTYRPHPERPGTGHGANGGGSWWPFVAVIPEPHYRDTNTPRRGSDRRDERPGSLQLQIEPGDATVSVDGSYTGRADDLRGTGMPLRPGSHRIEIRASGYETRTFDVRLTAGDTVIYRQTLDRERPAVPPAPVVPAPRKPLYVIPGCYAGDKPPSAPTRCDLTQLRTIR